MSSTKHLLYMRAYCNALETIQEILKQGLGVDHKDYKRLINQAIFYGVRSVITQPKRENITSEGAETDFFIAQDILGFMGGLTPAEFINIFPIKKVYDGNRWECKDYFYTRDYIRSLDPEKPIGDNALDFLWEYLNIELQMFTVTVMGYMDNLRRSEGQGSLMEEWVSMNGLTTYRKYTDYKGSEFLLDRETGKTIKLEKPKPRRRLKLVKGVG